MQASDSFWLIFMTKTYKSNWLEVSGCNIRGRRKRPQYLLQFYIQVLEIALILGGFLCQRKN